MKIEEPEVEDQNFSLRDRLALDRTLLSNERTLLAYWRSGMALLIAGLTIYHFSGIVWYTVVGLTCIPLGLIIGLVGTQRYQKRNDVIRGIRDQMDQEADPAPRRNVGSKD